MTVPPCLCVAYAALTVSDPMPSRTLMTSSPKVDAADAKSRSDIGPEESTETAWSSTIVPGTWATVTVPGRSAARDETAATGNGDRPASASAITRALSADPFVATTSGSGKEVGREARTADASSAPSTGVSIMTSPGVSVSLMLASLDNPTSTAPFEAVNRVYESILRTNPGAQTYNRSRVGPGLREGTRGQRHCRRRRLCRWGRSAHTSGGRSLAGDSVGHFRGPAYSGGQHEHVAADTEPRGTAPGRHSN